MRRSCVRNLHRVYASGARAFPQSRVQSGKLVASTLGQNFYAAIVIIAHPAGNAQHVRLAFHEPAESHPLHPSADDVAFGFRQFLACRHL